MIKQGLENEYFLVPNVIDININQVRSKTNNKKKKNSTYFFVIR